MVALAVAAPGLAQNVVGNWKGKVVLDATKIPKAPNAEAQKRVDAGLAMVKKLQIGLSLRANKTFLATVSGGPVGAGKKQTSEGTWKQSGSTILLTSTKQNGKPAKDNSPQTLTIAPGGRSLTMKPGGKGSAPGVKILFTR